MEDTRLYGSARVIAIWLWPLLLGAASPVIYNFKGGANDGANPQGSVAVNTAGQLFGTAAQGGSTGNGIVFQLTPAGGSWKESVLYNFLAGSDGAEPESALLISGASLYGTTSMGGSSTGSGFGTVFQMRKSASGWSESVLYGFSGGSDGAYPKAGVVLSGSVLYGTTYSGGTANAGVVYSLTPQTAGVPWQEAVLNSFGGAPNDGANPYAPLTAVSSTLFYGTTYNGGSSKLCTGGCGTVFKLQQSGRIWTKTILYNFGASSFDGKHPPGQVVVDSQGVIYGTTLQGGIHGRGTVFSLTPSGTSWVYGVVHNFAGGANDGSQPRSGVTLGTGGVLYGATVEGGGSTQCAHGCGTLYSLTPSGSTWIKTILYKFQGGTGAGADGAQPYAGVVYLNGFLYGTTYAGGTSTACAATQGCGTVYAFPLP